MTLNFNIDRFSDHDKALVERAADSAAKAHAEPRDGHPQGQKRKYTGDPYHVHTLAVAKMVYDLAGTAEDVAAALLHDTLEDTETSVHELRVNFGDEVTATVIELTDMPPTPGVSRTERKQRDIRRLALASKSAQTIKCCDLIDNTASIAERDRHFARHKYLPEKRAVLMALTRPDALALEMAYQALENAERKVFGKVMA